MPPETQDESLPSGSDGLLAPPVAPPPVMSRAKALLMDLNSPLSILLGPSSLVILERGRLLIAFFPPKTKQKGRPVQDHRAANTRAKTALRVKKSRAAKKENLIHAKEEKLRALFIRYRL